MYTVYCIHYTVYCILYTITELRGHFGENIICHELKSVCNALQINMRSQYSTLHSTHHTVFTTQGTFFSTKKRSTPAHPASNFFQNSSVSNYF